jgi:DNA-binding NarL/FixJ family response regulator
MSASNMPGRTDGASAIVVAGDEETRVLLRGLLRLHHYRVIGEAEGSTEGTELLRTHPPSVMVVDAALAEGSFPVLIREARLLRPEMRVVLVTPTPVRPGDGTPKGADGPDATVTRPFRLADFLVALQGKTAGNTS